jgi:Ser-tRNA(Ala) deacylase AlaX
MAFPPPTGWNEMTTEALFRDNAYARSSEATVIVVTKIQKKSRQNRRIFIAFSAET